MINLLGTGPVHKPVADSQLIGDVGQLELITRRVVDGLFAGKHRSTHRGGHCEFAHHRPYSPGDETRLIDWRVYAKSDRYFIKQFDEETNLRAMLLIDGSGSMNFGMSTASKFSYARAATACLARLLLRQRDAVGLCTLSDKQRRLIPPKTQARHLQSMLELLRMVEPGGTVHLAAELESAAQRLKRRGLIMVFSDFFDGTEALTTALRRVRVRGHDVVLFHILAPEEVEFDFRQPAQFVSLESASHSLATDPAALRAKYLAAMTTYLEQMQRLTTEVGCDYVRILTSEDLGRALTRYLRLRSAKTS